MSTITILGDGALGPAIAARLRERGDIVSVRGRPPSGRHELATIAGSDVVIDASRAEAVASNVTVALAAGVRRFVVATTGWQDDRERIAAAVERVRATAVVAPNLALGAALFLRLVDEAARLAASIGGFEPSVVEWHRRTKADRPSGTAAMLAGRIVDAHPRATSENLEVVSIRAGSAPGMHLVGFDAPGETVELRLTARDRSAYVAGILAAADWLAREPRTPGLHPFDPVVDELLQGTTVATPVPVVSAA
jgi:4-hydroxy-tetrahydrodipicolinate reductase